MGRPPGRRLAAVASTALLVHGAAAVSAPPRHAGGVAAPRGNGLVAFTSDRAGNDEVWVMAPDGSGQTNLTNDALSDSQPAWSPDGTRIAFTSNRTGNNEIFVMNADGSAPVDLSNNPAPDSQPAWSPDGTRIAFTSRRSGNNEV